MQELQFLPVRTLTYYFLIGSGINPFTIFMSQYREMGTRSLKNSLQAIR